MDELEISGKRYISARLAAKLHRYHSDYIGQLVRGGKVEGQKVGRAWYVNEDSLNAYFNKEGGVAVVQPAPVPVIAKKVIKKIAPKPAPIAVEEIIEEEPIEEVAESVVEDTQTMTIDEPVVEEEIIEEVEVAVAPKPLAKTPERQVHHIAITKVMPRSQKGLTYSRDEEPLFPAIKKNPIAITKIVQTQAVTDVKPETDEEADLSIEQRPRRSNIVLRSLTVVALGAILFTVVGLLTSRIASTIQVHEGGPASVGYTLQ